MLSIPERIVEAPSVKKGEKGVELPIAGGLSLSRIVGRPSRSIGSGCASLNIARMLKRIELLQELVPSARAIALLVNSASPALAQVVLSDSHAAALGLELHVLNANTESDFDRCSQTLFDCERAGS